MMDKEKIRVIQKRGFIIREEINIIWNTGLIIAWISLKVS